MSSGNPDGTKLFFFQCAQLKKKTLEKKKWIAPFARLLRSKELFFFQCAQFKKIHLNSRFEISSTISDISSSVRTPSRSHHFLTKLSINRATMLGLSMTASLSAGNAWHPQRERIPCS